MTTLYIGSIFLVILGIVFSLWPYIKYGIFNRIDDTSEVTERGAVNVSLYRDHLEDLDASLKIGSIDKEQYEQLKNELERNLIEDSHVSRINTVKGQVDSNTTSTSEEINASLDNKLKSKVHIPVFLSFIVLLPLAGIGLYQHLGNADAVMLEAKLARQAQLQEQLAISSDPEKLFVELSQLGREIVDGLAERVATRKVDLDTRVLLARNAVNIGDYATAIENFQAVLDVQPQAPQVMVELAQAIFINENNNAIPIVGALAEQALSIQPDNVMGLGLLGITRFQSGDYQQAIDAWERAIDIYPPGSQNGLALLNGVEQARQRLAASGLDANEQSNEQNAIAENEVDNSKAIKASLSVDVSLADNVPFEPDQIVFIYARAWQGAKLPLAITRVLASQLPITVELDDTMAMAPQFNLSSAETVQLVARVSVTGNPIAAMGDWEAISGPIELKSDQSSKFTLEISEPYSSSN